MEKIIHYCWFGNSEIPKKDLKCITSWKKYMPDYELKLWNESNFDINVCQYVREAYDAKKWAFVSDFARIYILYKYGGVYFDTDVELIKPIDELIDNGSFMGRENVFPKLGVNPGLGMYANPGEPFYKELLDDYYNSVFINEDGSYNLLSIVDRTSNLFIKHNATFENEVQKIMNITIYPKEYLCPLDYDTNVLDITDKTYSIHWFRASWFNEKMKKRRNNCIVIRKYIHGNLGEQACKVYMKISYLYEGVLTGKYLYRIKKVLKLKKKKS